MGKREEDESCTNKYFGSTHNLYTFFLFNKKKPSWNMHIIFLVMGVFMFEEPGPYFILD